MAMTIEWTAVRCMHDDLAAICAWAWETAPDMDGAGRKIVQALRRIDKSDGPLGDAVAREFAGGLGEGDAGFWLKVGGRMEAPLRTMWRLAERLRGDMAPAPPRVERAMARCRRYLAEGEPLLDVWFPKEDYRGLPIRPCLARGYERPRCTRFRDASGLCAHYGEEDESCRCPGPDPEE